VVTRLGADGTMALYNEAGRVHLVADLVAWLPAESPNGVQPVAPTRLLDTRPGAPTVDGEGSGGGPMHAGEVRTVRVAGRGPIPVVVLAGADQVLLTVTSTGATEPSFVTVWPTGFSRPSTSNVNLRPGDDVANLVLTRVGPDGTISLFNYAGQTDLVVDVVAWANLGAGLNGAFPVRLLDTRPGGATVDGVASGGGPVSGGQVVTVPVVGRQSVNTIDVGAVIVNVTSTEATSPSYITAWPSGTPRPLASSLNLDPGHDTSNLAVVRLGPDGAIALYNYAGHTDLLVDMVGSITEFD